MIQSTLTLSLTLVFSAIAVCFYVKHKHTGSQLPLPPGPPADPLIGHVRSMPRLYPWKTLAEWGKVWGGIIHIHILGKSIIIISDLAIARELLDKRGSIYSDRPRYVLICEMMGWNTSLAFIPYGDRFRKHRKMIQQQFNSQAVVRFRTLQRAEIFVLLDNLLKSPGEFDRHIKRAIAGTLMMVTYGRQVVADDDEYVNLVERATSLTVAPGTPGSTSPDFLPFLRHIPKWFPGAELQRHAIKTKEATRTLLDLPYDTVKRNRILGKAKPSFLSHLLDEYEEGGVTDPEHEEDIKGVCAVIYGAGFETACISSQSTLLTFVLAMTRHPEVAKRAQEEIDITIGQSCMPTIEDRNRLPFIDCILKECLRWNPPVPLGIPHRVMEEDEYHGMCIPRGATIIANIWQMLRDDRYFLNPEQFIPDRFYQGSVYNLAKAGYEDENNPLNVVFGFGRRTCPGNFLAESSLWLAMASILAAFDIKRPLDVSGKEYTPEAHFTTGIGRMFSQPTEFQCRIISRGERYEKMIRQEQTISTY